MKGKIMLRGRWTSWAEQLEKNTPSIGNNKLLGAEMMGYTSDHFFSSNHVIYPLLRPVDGELLEMFEPAFLANAVYRFRDPQAALDDLRP